MKIKSVDVRDFKHFSELHISGLPEETRIVVLVGPNGSGKSSLFEVFNYWFSQARQSIQFVPDYHVKIGSPEIQYWHELMEKIDIRFHDAPTNFENDPTLKRKAFYFRSAYRHEADFTVQQLEKMGDILEDQRRPRKMIDPEIRVSDNYQRIVAAGVENLFDPAMKNEKVGMIADRLVGRVREAMKRIFPDLVLSGPGRPMEGGTFLFEKGMSLGYHYKNLSGGEKAAFDLLLDFIVKSEAFNETVFCIDEPDLHMHTRLQASLLDELHRQLPKGCQLWLATHSIGMTRRAMELHRTAPDNVTFLDFGGRNFDIPQTMTPVAVDRTFWKQVFGVALDDLAELVAPSEIVFCEGGKESVEGQRTPSFDATVYRTIFASRHPDTEFVPLGGTPEVEKDALLISGVLGQLFNSMTIWSVFDRDDRSEGEVSELESKSIRVLRRRNLESYIWDDEVLEKLCDAHNQLSKSVSLLEQKERLLKEAQTNGKPADDVKYISGRLYNEAKRSLSLVGCGNNARAFARDTLAPLITQDMRVYRELEEDVFAV